MSDAVHPPVHPADPDPAGQEESEVLTTLGDGRVVTSSGADGRAVIEFVCRPEMCHSGGVAQGGFVTGWIDSAMARACIDRYTEAYWIATLELKVSFFRPARPGPVRAEGWIERAGKQTVFTEGHLLDPDGQVLAKASSTIRLVPDRA
ncbi:MAG: PaaI family thioesterase [Acidimicrobiales bacterium]